MNTSNAATPSFYNDSKHQIKAQPIGKDKTQDKKQSYYKDKISSVFSPIPCKPQSQCGIFGVRGDNNTPYTPFNRQDTTTPKMTPTSRIFKTPAPMNGLGLQ